MISLNCTVLSFVNKDHILYKDFKKKCIEQKFNLINCFDFVDFTTKLMNLKPNIIIIDIISNKVSQNTLNLISAYICENQTAIAVVEKDADIVSSPKYIKVKSCDLINYIDTNANSWKFSVAIKNNIYKECTNERNIQINAFLYKLGFSPKHRGYNYLKEIIAKIISNNGDIGSLNNDYYPMLSAIFKTNSCNIERAIRSSIEYAWNNAQKGQWQQEFHHNMYGASIKPSNREFICLCAEKLMNGF